MKISVSWHLSFLRAKNEILNEFVKLFLLVHSDFQFSFGSVLCRPCSISAQLVLLKPQCKIPLLRFTINWTSCYPIEERLAVHSRSRIRVTYGE